MQPVCLIIAPSNVLPDERVLISYAAASSARHVGPAPPAVHCEHSMGQSGPLPSRTLRRSGAAPR